MVTEKVRDGGGVAAAAVAGTVTLAVFSTAVGVPEITPDAEIDRPAGRPDAAKDSVWSLDVVLAWICRLGAWPTWVACAPGFFTDTMQLLTPVMFPSAARLPWPLL